MDMVVAVQTAMVQGMVASMDPSRQLVIDQLTNMGRNASITIIDAKASSLDRITTKINTLRAAGASAEDLSKWEELEAELLAI